MAIDGYNSERCILCGVPLIQKAAVYSYMSGGVNLIGCAAHSKLEFWRKAYAIGQGGTPAPSTEPQPEVDPRSEPLPLIEVSATQVEDDPNNTMLKNAIRKLKEKLDAKSQN